MLVAFLLLIAGVCLFTALKLAIHRAEPILKARVIDTLSTRYNSRVELDQFHVSLVRGFEAQGAGLRIYPNRLDSGNPLFSADQFRFRVSWLDLLHSPMHVTHVYVGGLDIHLPPKQQRKELPRLNPKKDPSRRGIKIHVDEIVIEHAHLVLGTNKPGKQPLDFVIKHVHLRSGAPGQPLSYQATLINARPVGEIQSTGHFGPFQQDSPGDTPVNGSYIFSHADLGTFKGIAGILSSTGKFRGPLDQLTVDGETDVPDFRLSSGQHPMPLHTTFHAVVDGTNGNTYLQPVDAQLVHSHFICRGSVVRAAGGHGHDINLDVVVDNARIEDFLNLAVRTRPPVMNGDLHMKTKLYLPPGEVPVPRKLHLTGSFDVSKASFGNDKVQKRVNELSLLGEGHPQELKESAQLNVPAQVSGNFVLGDGKLTLSGLNFTVPGADIVMNGIYSLDGNQFDFHGKAKLQAHVSQMTTGWKSLLLKAVDPFLAKNGVGTEIPIKITGTKSDPHFGVDFGHKSGPKKP